jgi:hypothetical protein
MYFLPINLLKMVNLSSIIFLFCIDFVLLVDFFGCLRSYTDLSMCFRCFIGIFESKVD